MTERSEAHDLEFACKVAGVQSIDLQAIICYSEYQKMNFGPSGKVVIISGDCRKDGLH